jgi:hypothetical protein
MSSRTFAKTVGLRPRAVVESAACGLDREVDILAVGFGDVGDHGAGGRVIDRERLARRRRDEPAVDQELSRPLDELPYRSTEPRVESNGVHAFPPRLGPPYIPANIGIGMMRAVGSAPRGRG